MTVSDPNVYPRETREYVKFTDVAVDGVPVTDFEYAVTAGSARPATWQTPTTVDGKQAFLLDGTRAPGDYRVWVRVTATPEAPVIEAGWFTLT